MILVVNIYKQDSIRGTVDATRIEWALSPDKAPLVDAVVGLIEGQIVCVIEGCHAVQNPDTERFRLEGGTPYTGESEVLGVRHELMFKRIGSTRNFRYFDSVEDIKALIQG